MASQWNDRKWARIITSAILIAIIGYGAFLRFYDLGVSLYDDEINTRERAMQSVSYTLETRYYPLYYLCAKVSLRLFGDSEMALRLPSFLAGLLAILAIYGLVRQLHSRTAGLVAAALLAFNPFHITHSDFARYYALLMLFTILTVWSLYLLLERGRWHQWLAYTASAFLAVASHVCFLPALAALNAGAALYLLFGRRKFSLKRRVLQVGMLACCTLLACGFVIYRGYGPFDTVKSLLTLGDTPVSAATETPVEKDENAATVGNLPEETPPGPSVFEAHERRTRGSGAVFTDPDTGKEIFLLTYYDFLEFLKRYFWTDTPWVWPLLIVVGVCGALDLLYRLPAAGLPLFFGFFATPAGLFFVQVSHWYHPRYLSFCFIFALIFVAIGLCMAPRFLSRVIGAPRSLRLWRRVPEPRPARTLTIANVLYVLTIAGFAVPAVPIIDEAYQTYPVHGYLPQGPLVTNRVPERDWRGLYAFVSRTARQGDQFLFMSPSDQHGPRYAKYYLQQFRNWPEESRNFDYRFGAPTHESMHRFAQEHPMANFWCVGYIKHFFTRHSPLLKKAGATEVGFYDRNRNNGISLFFRGAPTTNHIPNGSFEGRMNETQPEGVHVDEAGGYNGPKALRIEYTASEGGAPYGTTLAKVPVGTASYRLRNNGFEAWRDGKPVGWNTSATPDQIALVRPGFEEGTSLRIAPSNEPVILQQGFSAGLAPGRTMNIQMMGLSHTPNNLHLVLRYRGPGYEKEVHTVHPGTGGWVLMRLDAEIPDDADPDGFALEVWRVPGGEGDAIVDKMEFRVAETGGSLEPDQPYVLSLSVRSQNLKDARGADQQPAGRVRLAWTDADGTKGQRDLMEIHNDPAWRQLSATFTPGTDIPRDLASLEVQIGILEGSGVLWADEIQLEKGTTPTIFTETFRLPHDEELATVDLTPFEMEAAW